MYGCENWTKKKAERQRIDAFNCVAGEDSWESLRLPRRSNQSILKEINPEYSFEGLMLKLQYFGRLIQRADSLEKTLILRRIEGGRWRGSEDGWMASLTQWTWVWVSSGRWWRTGRPGVLQSMGSQSQTQQSSNISSMSCRHLTGRFSWKVEIFALMPSRTPWGWARRPFGPPFLVGNTSASMTLSEFQRAEGC